MTNWHCRQAHSGYPSLHTGRVSNYSWPDDGELLAERAQRAWPETIAALAMGTRIAGEVIARQPFGVFVRIDGALDAVGLAEITAMPRAAELPGVTTRVTGEVIGHAAHNHQVRIRLISW